ncbi:MAG: ABC transporter permease [Actinomycetota bacterium]
MTPEETSLILRTAVGLLVIVAATIALQRWFDLRLGSRPLTAVLRAAIQLSIIAVVLRGVLEWPALVAAFFALMFTTASLTAGSRLRELWRGRTAALLGVLAGGIGSAGAVLALGLVEIDARYVVAIGGILIGNAMTAATLSGRNFRTMAIARASEVEAWLSLGAPPRVAFGDIARRAVYEALVPTIDTTRSTGLVTLPGAFVGALFGGASPIEAARFQLVVLTGIMLNQTLTGITVTSVLSRAPVIPLEAAVALAPAARRARPDAVASEVAPSEVAPSEVAPSEEAEAKGDDGDRPGRLPEATA